MRINMEMQNSSYYQNESETSSRLKSFIGNSNNFRSNHATSSGNSGRPNPNSLASRRRQEIYNSSQIQTARPSFPAQRLRSDDEAKMKMPDQKSSRSIPERVESIYYTLGLFCSSHPLSVILFAAAVVIFSCFPLLSLPFLGNKPKEFVTPYQNFTSPPANGFDGDWPRWYRGPPTAYIQQIIVKSAVYPWGPDMILTDAFRGPLGEVFNITKLLKTFSLENDTSTISKFCFTVGEVKSRVLRGKVSMLPEFGCLIVSPANFWQQNYQKFREDPDILGTILNYQSHQKGRSGLAEILLGMGVRDTGLKRYPLKARPRIVSYAITIVLQTFDPSYVESLRSELTRIFPSTSPQIETGLDANSSRLVDSYLIGSEDEDELNIIHIFYPSQSSIFELIPLVFTYVAMFIYVYFSVKKVEMITSKFGMSISALATVVASLCMSVGLCTHFGMTFELNSKAIYPYLVVVIGLENILVLTRSVVSTSANLDVKIRVAQGLSKEGWSITKNLLSELTILTFGFFTFIPAVQEFCILAIVGLLSDFFLQTFFFATVLSVDIHRMKLSPDSTRDLGYANHPLRTPIHPSNNTARAGLHRVKSNPQFKYESNGSLKHIPNGGSVSVVAPSQNTPILVKIPKRLRLIYFWAKTRFFQRTFTIFMIGWLSVIIYESGIIARFVHEPEDIAVPLHHQDTSGLLHNSSQIPLSLLQSSEKLGKPILQIKGMTPENATAKMHNHKIMNELYSHNPYIWRRLTPYHWQVLFGVYNATLVGKYISILPSICVSVTVDPKAVIPRRHPHESQRGQVFNWQALAQAFDPIDLVDEYDSPSPTGAPVGKTIRKGLINASDDPYVPSSPVELALVMLLAIPSVIFIAYLFVVLYRLVCSRNYAEWRSSWTKSKDRSQDSYTQVVFEAVPLVLDGHLQDVECISSDGNIIASVCLAGVLKVWNVTNGENIVTVDRPRYFERQSGEKEDNSFPWISSDAESSGCSPPDRDNLFARNNSFERPSSSTGSLYSGGNAIRSGVYNCNSLERGSRRPQQTSTQGIPIPNNHRSSKSPQISPSSRSPSSKISIQNSQGRNDILDDGICISEDKTITGTINRNVSVDSAFIDDVPPVWCLDCQENLVILGTGSGRLEVWDSNQGILKCIYEDGNQAGVVCIKIVGNRIISARLNGSLDFIELVSNTGNGRSMESPSPYHRWKPGDDITDYTASPTYAYEAEADVKCIWLATQKAHQQPISCLECDGGSGRIVTGSQDHTLKVFKIEDHSIIYTLHGHYGPITCMFIDKFSPMISGSGSHDGMLCVWDLFTGMCVYSIQAHDGPISALTYSASYIISVGGDDKICVWERFQGHILNTIQLDHAYCSSLVMLTHNLLITSKQGSLVVWDVRSGQAVRVVRLGHRDNAVFVRQIMGCADAVLCDYGSQLRLVRFPSVVNKMD